MKEVPNMMIIELSERAFNQLFPKAFECNKEGKYSNLPKRAFLLEAKDGKTYFTAIDNTELCCWVEEFSDRDAALEWLND